MNEARLRLGQFLIPVAREVLDAEGGDPAARPIIQTGGAIVATIGFAGLDISGALAVVAPESIARALVTSVFETEPQDERFLCDMLGELSNMLLGRYRAVLLREGLEILPATPITVRAQDVDVRGDRNEQAQWHAFTTKAGSFWLCLDVSFRHDFSFAAPSAEPVVSNELEFVLF